MSKNKPPKLFDIEAIEAQEALDAERRQALSKKLGEIASVGAIALLSLTLVGVAISGSPAETSEKTKECEDPSAADRAKVDKNIDLAGRISPTEIINTDFDEFVAQQAERADLTLVDDAPYLKRLEQSGTVSSTTDVAANFMENYDIKFNVLEDRHEADPVRVKPIKEDDMNAEDYREAAYSFIRNFRLIPIELVEESADVKDIEIIGDTGKSNIVGTYSPTVEGINIEYSAFISTPQSTPTHEMMHGINKSICGSPGWYRDPSIRKLNKGIWRYGPDNFNPTNVLNSHAAEDPEEDKAELGERFLTGINPIILYPSYANSVTHKKTILLLGRLERQVPNISYYIAAINRASLFTERDVMRPDVELGAE